jgi:tetratricopeptide (TPR) repeat protein
MLVFLGYAIGFVLAFFLAISLKAVFLGFPTNKDNNYWSRKLEILTGLGGGLVIICILFFLKNWLALDKNFITYFSITTFVLILLVFYRRIEEIKKGRELAYQGRKLQADDTGNPFEIGKLSEALKFYQEANKLINDPKLRTVEKNLEKELERRKEFLDFFKQGKELGNQGYFKKALGVLESAQALYSHHRIGLEIQKCRLQVEQENICQVRLKKAQELARQGELKQSRELINQALADFQRLDVKNLLTKVEQITIAFNYFEQGVAAEKNGDLNKAIDNYRKALLITPELIDINRRLGITNIKAGNYREGIEQLEGIEDRESIYFRGYGYARLQEWRKAHREWKKIDRPEIKEQIELLSRYSQREKLTLQQEIQELIPEENLELARSKSEVFLEKFGDDPQVIYNLYSHILPRIDQQLWRSKDREKIVINAEREWEKKRNLESLHNLAIALYYRAVENPATLEKLIPVWLSATANLNLNTSVRNVVWKVIDDGDIRDLEAQLTRILEELIDRTKEDLNYYLQLRDLYRRDAVALGLLRDHPLEGIQIEGLTILPGLYRTHPDRNTVKLPEQFWATLYTRWGESVAACLQGDRVRGVALKPLTCQSTLEQIANTFVSFHQGCHYLQQKQWQKAENPLKEAKTALKNHPEWIEEIDRLYLELQEEIGLFVTLYAKSTDKMPRQHTSNPKIPKVSKAIASPFY